MSVKKSIRLPDSVKLPRAGQRSKYLFSVALKRQSMGQSKQEEALEDRIAFLPPLPSSLAIQSKAIDHDIIRVIMDQFVRFFDSKNISPEWARVFMSALDTDGQKHKFRSTKSSIVNGFRGTSPMLANPNLVAGPHIRQILQEEEGQVTDDPIETNSPKELSEISETPPIKKPRSRFMIPFFNEKSYGLSDLNYHLQEMVRRGTIFLDKFVIKTPMQRVRYRAKGSGIGPILPLQSLFKNHARWLFRMDVEDAPGTTAFSWNKWTHDQLSRHKTIAKSIADSIICFSVPSDLHQLEGLRVVDYLERYCKVDKQRLCLYETLYSRVKQMVVNAASIKEAALRLAPTALTEDNVDELLGLLDLPAEYSLKLDVFCKCLGLCERLFIPLTKGSEATGGLSLEEAEKWRFQAGPLERLDFWQLSRKLSKVNIDPALKRLLGRLERQTVSQSRLFPLVTTALQAVEKSVARVFNKAKRSVRRSDLPKQPPTIRFAFNY